MHPTLRQNSPFSGSAVTIIAAFAMVSTAHPHPSPLTILLFAVGAAVALPLIAGLTSQIHRRPTHTKPTRELTPVGALDALSIVIAVGIAAGCAQLPGTLAWPCTAFAATATHLLITAAGTRIAHQGSQRNGCDA